ncbi:NADH dehydrogenase [ubiquinone] 1 alpha subcomplex subunit 9, mitochondrial [Drosophila hydei]|uniref:NADH dehydrogenase [ubiquinone] 1 alpha subcomplex subunit 9, mitochondrial n=1 Tax=Drosophila hydei TaxID=7224 RepID=A0A6J1ML29_DROHY|nr:NADH dehydrogenase [ubiquinone] 1 alpha subcomplex subunit 9, mitochondrial [Drosophila hydei]
MAAIVLTRNMQLAKHHGSGIVGVICLRSYSAASAPPNTDGPRPLKSTNVAAMKRGTGGRSSFNGIVATVFGATGFVGRYVCNKLGKSGSQMILPYRGDDSDAIRLKVCGDLGQVLFHFYNLGDPASIREAVKHSNVVINLVGRDYETKNYKFKDVNIHGPARLASICRDAGVERFIHLSSLNVEANPKGHYISGGSQWLKTKYEGELMVRDAFPNATIIRPADIYGSEDRFLRYYAHIWRRQFRSMPLWHKGERTVKQPVFVSDVAQAIVNAAKDPDTAGRIYQAVGPKRYQLSELVDWFHRLMRKDQKGWGYHRYDLRWDPTFKLKVKLTNLICPGAPIGGLHLDRVEREFVTDKVIPGVPTLEDLGVQLTNMEDQVPWELRPYRAALYYDAELGEFETPSPPKTIEARDEMRLFA